ncbi:hypothetical protein [Nodosilinea nodulosa]|uniref:hypothetical protein n=1 Tax=Nodosilinea nodulosa TaxID=416001 RepID=UPI00030C7D5E|nr:hypothetical protein [Nodosilinea nodulosa]
MAELFVNINTPQANDAVAETIVATGTIALRGGTFQRITRISVQFGAGQAAQAATVNGVRWQCTGAVPSNAIGGTPMQISVSASVQYLPPGAPPGEHDVIEGTNAVSVMLTGPQTPPPPQSIAASSITTWMRLEPQIRSADMTLGLQARVYDPLWLMTRQWQIGEFQGEDNGSPAAAHWQGEAARCTRYYPGALAAQAIAPGQPYDSSTIAIETQVERERVRPQETQEATAAKLHLATEAGQQFLRLLDRQTLSKRYRDAFTRSYAFTPLTATERQHLDRDSLSFLDLVMARVPDGRKLYVALAEAQRSSQLPPNLQIAPADVAGVLATSAQWLRWYETLFSEPQSANPAWLPERMEYGFSLAARLASGEQVLTAEEYFSGRTDWYDFALNPGASLGAGDDPGGQPMACTTIPAPISYRGMPSPRFWEFEDAQVDFGAVSAAPEDLARLLLIEFALTYGNDWFVIPIELPVGSLCRTDSLVITNTFGDRTLIRAASDLGGPPAAWRMFQLSARPKPGQTEAIADANPFFLAPALVNSVAGKPIEDVLFLRDEMANMAWGVEQIVESATERPLNRLEQSSIELAAANPSEGILQYRLASPVPNYWIPLLPVQANDGLRLKRGAVLKADGAAELVQARGTILNPDLPDSPGLTLYEEEVPRESIRVTRGYHLARWMDGSTHLWVGRRKTVGRGEGSSGLRFDSIEEV